MTTLQEIETWKDQVNWDDLRPPCHFCPRYQPTPAPADYMIKWIGEGCHYHLVVFACCETCWHRPGWSGEIRCKGVRACVCCKIPGYYEVVAKL